MPNDYSWMTDAQKSLLNMYRTSLADHQLHVVHDGEYTKHFRMARKTEDDRWSRTMMVDIAQTDTTIITGDFHPGERGVIAHPPRGLRWFVNTSAQHMTTHFIPSDFNYELAVEGVQEHIDEQRQEGGSMAEKRIEELTHLKGLLEAREAGAHHIYEVYGDLGYDSEDMPGYGRDRAQQAQIIAIQEKFRELYTAYLKESS